MYNLPQLLATGVEFAFTFNGRHGHARRYVSLLRDMDGMYKALTLLTELSELVGHEEVNTVLFEDDLAGNMKLAIPIKDLNSGFENWRQQVERKPDVLIGTVLLTHVSVLWLTVCT